MNPAVKAYLATIGGAGGKATGPRKARSPEHYRAAQLKGAAARKRNNEAKRKANNLTD